MKKWNFLLWVVFLSSTQVSRANDVAVFLDSQYLCVEFCSQAYTPEGQQNWIRNLFEDALFIENATYENLEAALENAQTFVFPFTNRPTIPPIELSEEIIDLFRRFVQKGGNFISINDSSGNDVKTYLDLFFGIEFVGSDGTFNGEHRIQVPDFFGIPLLETIENTYYSVGYSAPFPEDLIPFYQMGNLLTAGAIPYGLGQIFLFGMMYFQENQNVGQSDVFRAMVNFRNSGHLCFLLGEEDGTGHSVRCHGFPKNGQLGYETLESEILPLSDQLDLNLGETFHPVKVKNGKRFSCALSNEGEIKCWGDNSEGQLGIGSTETVGATSGSMGDRLQTVLFSENARIQDFDIGEEHACAIDESGSVHCWGNGENGKLGSESELHQGDDFGEVAFPVSLPGAALQIALGNNHTCALLSDRSIVCFGKNNRGQLGLGHRETVGHEAGSMGSEMNRVDLGSNFFPISLTSGAGFSCATSTLGKVKCWGQNEIGQLGLGDTRDQGTEPGSMGEALLALDLGERQQATQVSCGNAHCCATFTQGTLKCWGKNQAGQLGLGDARNRGANASDMGDDLPFLIFQPLEVVQNIKAIQNSTCVSTNLGSRCFGSNKKGELGTGNNFNLGLDSTSIPLNLPFYEVDLIL